MSVFAISDDGKVKVEWEDLGEGVCGDYDPDDPEDVALLRFYSYYLDGKEWEPLDDGSYCTLTPVDTHGPVLIGLAQLLAAEIGDAYAAGGSVKKVCERLSWISPEWLDRSPASAL